MFYTESRHIESDKLYREVAKIYASNQANFSTTFKLTKNGSN
jgi:hypothetical protein